MSRAVRTLGTPFARRSFLKNMAATAAIAQIGGFSTLRLDRVRRAMARHVEQASVPGVVWLVSRGGEVHADALGTMAYGGREPLRRDSIFRIASASKPVTGVQFTQLLWTSPNPPPVQRDFWTAVYQALAD